MVAVFKVGLECQGAKSHLKSASHSVTSNQSRQSDNEVGSLPELLPGFRKVFSDSSKSLKT